MTTMCQSCRRLSRQVLKKGPNSSSLALCCCLGSRPCASSRRSDRHHPDHSFCMATSIENLACTRPAAATMGRFRYGPLVPDRATGTSPRAHRGCAHRRSRCGRRRPIWCCDGIYFCANIYRRTK
jgi:hypothetical protein